MISLVHRRGPWLHVLTVLVLCAAGWVLAQQKIEDRTPFADEVQYLVMAHNAFHRGTISLTPPDVAPPEPSAYREPGYPVFLAALMVFDAGALIVLSIAAARRVPAFCWFALPGLYNFGVHALVTLNLPRFNIPTLPTLAAAGSIVIWWIIARRRVRTRRILHESEGARGNAG